MNILDWRKKEEWLSSINEYAGDLIGDDLLVKIRSKKVKGCWSDDMSWLPDEEIVAALEIRFKEYYSHVKSFHGCRPIDVRSYYEKGLLGQNGSLLESQFRKIFEDVSGDLVEKAILDSDDRRSDEKGKIFFVCDDRNLIEDCGHYLIQGSEYIMAMAASLCRFDGSGEDYKLRLRKAGIPTIFEVDIPLEQVPSNQINELVRTILATWGTNNLFPKDIHDYDMSFVLHSDVNPKNISSHSHPKKINDPHFYNSQYRPKVTSV